MTKREFTAVYQKRRNHYIAWIEEVPRVNTRGRTKKEAQENLREALILILEANRNLALRHFGKITSSPTKNPQCFRIARLI